MGFYQTNKALEAYIKSYATGIPGPVPGGDAFPNTYSLDFDGVDEYVTIYNGASGSGPIQFTASDSFTLSAWIKTSSTAAQNQIISFRGTALIWLYTTVTSGNIRLEAQIRDDSSNAVVITSYNTSDGWITADAWTNVVFTRNGSTNTMNLYLNGVAAQVPTSDTTSDDFTAYDKLSIGNDNYSGGRYWFDGNIDELSIYSAELSASQVTDLYNSGSPTDLSSFEVAPVAWYRMGDSTKALYFNSIWQIPNEMKVGNFSQYSFYLDGGGFENFPLTTPVSLGTVHTISLWVIYIGNNRVALGGTSEYAVFITGTSVYTHPNGGGYNSKTIATIADGNWHHICLSRDGSTMTWYHNGIDIGTSTEGGTCTVGTIGAYDGGAYQYRGNLSDIALFDEAKSGVEVAAIYNSGTPTDLSHESGLQGYWTMGENATWNAVTTEWTIADQSGNGNNSTSVGMEIEDRETTAPGNISQANSINLEEADRVEDTP